MQLSFFEDPKSTTFYPLTLTRPLDDLRIGILTIREKWQQSFNTSQSRRILRTELKEVFDTGETDPGQSSIWINSRFLPSDELVECITDLSEGQCLRHNNTVIAAKVAGTDAKQWLDKGSPDFSKLFVLETSDFLSISNLWDLFQLNGREIVRDIELLSPGADQASHISENVVFENRNEIYLGDGATIEANCVLNAAKGPIYVGKNATIMSGTHLRGPIAICDGATIKMGARIYEDTTIGPVCKVGGEVHNSIFHSYSNKAHDGFLGNSVIGQWCNFGADTNTSNLKNNYSPIRITRWDDREEIDTGQQFFGTVMGDHSKTAINTQLNTGTICGVSCNIFSNDFPPKLIPSFSWVGSNVIQKYRLEKAFEAMEAIMARRKVPLTDEYRAMMEAIFKSSN